MNTDLKQHDAWFDNFDATLARINKTVDRISDKLDAEAERFAQQEQDRKERERARAVAKETRQYLVHFLCFTLGLFTLLLLGGMIAKLNFP